MVFNYELLFKSVKRLFLFFIAVFMVDTVWGIIYFIIHVGISSPNFGILIFDIIVGVLSFYLVCKNIFLGNVLIFSLAVYGIYGSYVIFGGLFAWKLLSWGPQIFFSNALNVLLVIFSIIHFYLLVDQKFKQRFSFK